MPDPSDVPATRGARSVPRVVWAAVAAFAVLGAVWSIVAPLGEAPDEPAHLALVLHLADGNPYPDYDGLENQAAIIRLCRTYAASTRACPRQGEVVTPTSVRRHPREEAPNRAVRPAWDDEGGDRAVGQVNQMPQHPPLYYQAMASVLRLERALNGGPWSADRELALLRLANVALLSPLPLLAWWGAVRLRASRTVAIAAALAVLLVPMLAHIGSTLNNDNLLTLLGAVILALCCGVLRGDRSWRTAILLGIAAGLAMLTKAFGIVFPPAIALAYLVGRSPSPDEPSAVVAPADPVADEDSPSGWRGGMAPLAVAGAVTAVVAAWWYVGVRVRTGRFAPTVESERYTADLRPPGFSPDAGAFLGEFVRNLNTRFWGSFGWYSVRVPAGQAAVATLAVVVALAAALSPRHTADGSTRLQRLVLLVPFGLLGGFVLLRAWDLYVTSSRFQFMQGRYLFAGLLGVWVLLAVGLTRLVGRWAPLVVNVAAAALQLDGLRRALVVWWGGPSLGPRGQVRAAVAWGSWPGELVGALLVAAVAAGLWLAVELVAELLGRTSDAPAAGGGGPVAPGAGR